MVSQGYKAFYKKFNQWSEEYWASDRPDREADLWMCQERNRLSLKIIGRRFAYLSVLAVGAGLWIEREFLEALPAGRLVRTDLVEGDGIDMLVDATDMQFDNASFDAVICRELIEHVPDDELLMSEISRVLRPGGYLHITTPNGLNVPPKDPKDGGVHVRAYGPIGFLQHIEKYGYDIIAKKGMVPNVYSGLLPLAYKGSKIILDEFKQQAEIFNKWEYSYYFGSHLIVLARKK